MDPSTKTHRANRTDRTHRTNRIRRSEAGEGVISAAIAVLIMAFLGAAMWLAFSHTMHTAQSKVDTNVANIGTGGN